MKISNGRILIGKIIAAVLIIIGVADVIFFSVGIAAFIDLQLSGEENQLIPLLVCVAFTALGIWMIVSGVKRNQLITICKSYAAILAGGAVNRVDQLARITGQSCAMVRRRLKKIISLGYIKEIYFDHTFGDITVNVSECNDTEVTTVSVRCPVCGGTTELPVGSVGKCEYCCSVIRG